MASQQPKGSRAARKRARNDAATSPVQPDGDGNTTTTTTTPHGPHDTHGPHTPHGPSDNIQDSVESVHSTPRPDGSYPAIPSTHDGRILPSDAVYTSQPVRAEEVTVWALSLARKATNGVVRTVARQDATGYGQDVRDIQRLLELRTNKSSPTGFTQVNTTRPQNVDAMYGYMFGDAAPDPCATCKKSCGPFADCIVHPDIGSGSCTNCHYGSMGNRCTLRTGEDTAGTPRPRKRVKSEKEAPKEPQENRVRVAYLSQRSIAALKKFKAVHWEAIRELADSAAAGKWEYKEEPRESDLEL